MLAWRVVDLVFYCFQYYLLVVGGQMNYASTVLDGVGILSVCQWLFQMNSL